MGQFVIITCEPPRRDFACKEEKVRFCTNWGADFAYTEEKTVFCTNLNEKFAF